MFDHDRHGFVNYEQLKERLEPIERQLMSTQADVDAVTALVAQVATDLATAQADLQTQIDALAAANPAVSLTALQAAVAPLDAAVVALETLAPTPPAPAPAPAPAPPVPPAQGPTGG